MAFDMDLPAPTFDLETYASNYEGSLLPLRLGHISTRCPPLARQALTLAIAAAKKGQNVSLYSRLHDTAARLGFSDLAQMDVEWLSRQEEGNRRELARLEGELRGYKNNMIRESTRMGQEDLAAHHLRTGGPPFDPNNPQSATNSGLAAAYSSFVKMRDYCTTPTHVAGMTLRLIYTGLLQAVVAQQMGSSGAINFNTALANAQRLRSVGVKEEDMVRLTPIMHAMSGIAQMSQGQYRDAASSFLSTPIEYATLGAVQTMNFPRLVATGNDIAIYGGLCALATMSRDDLVEKVLGGSFRAFLELEPHLRKAISLYTNAKYQACISILQHYYADWNLDLFLGAGGGVTVNGSHVDRLFHRIRERSITAYFSSFSQVSLASLASTFPPTLTSSTQTLQQAIEREIISMIENGKLAAKIDVVNGLLIAPQKDARSATHAEAKKAAEEVERTLLLRLGKVNAVLAGLEVPRGKGGGASMSMGGWGVPA